MEATICIDTISKTARNALTGTALPNVPIKFQAHLKLTVFFSAAGAAPAQLAEGTSFNVTLKALASAGGTLFAQKVDPTATNDTSYEFEWPKISNAALLAALGDSVDGIAAVLTIGWTLDSVVEKVDLPVTIANTWQRDDDVLPPDASASDEFLRARALVYDAPQSLTGAQRAQALANLGLSIVNGALRIVDANDDILNAPLNTGEPSPP